MKRTLSWIIGIPVALIIILVVVSNREWTTFSLDPFSATNPWFAIELPLYLLFLVSIVLGMLIGGASAWLAQGKWRKAARRAEAEVRTLKTQKDTLRRDAETAGRSVVERDSGA